MLVQFIKYENGVKLWTIERKVKDTIEALEIQNWLNDTMGAKVELKLS